MKLFCLILTLVVLCLHSGLGDLDDQPKEVALFVVPDWEDPDIEVDSLEHIHRKQIMWKHESFFARVFTNTSGTMTEKCKAAIMKLGEVVVFEECSLDDPSSLMVQYRCHKVDDQDEVTEEYYEFGTKVKVVAETGIKNLAFITTTTFSTIDECVVFTTSEAHTGKTVPNFFSQKNLQTVTIYKESGDDSLSKSSLEKEHDEL